MQGGDCIRVVHPLFPVEGGGSTPTSPLQLHIARMDKRLARLLNEQWQSRLPLITNWQACDAFGAEFDGIFYAVALWSEPVARALNGRGWYELRRFAISPEAPKNTASRMLSIMRRMIQKDRPDVVKLISYQDTDVHFGTIYKSAGWSMDKVGERIDEDAKWNNWKTRKGRQNHSAAPKNRWTLTLRNPDANSAARTSQVDDHAPIGTSNGELFADTASDSN